MTLKKNILLTGASGQIGRSFIDMVDFNTFNLIGVDIVMPDKPNPNVEYFIYDLNNLEKKKSIYNSFIQENKNIDILINNAGVSTFSNFMDRTESEFDYVMNTNLKSVFFEIQSFLKLFNHNNQSYGKIINIGSIFGSVSSDERNYIDLDRKSPECYGASKAGIIQLTRYFAAHLAKKNISVNCISPGGVYNKENPQGPKFIKKYSEKVPFARMADVCEVAELIYSVVQLKSNYMTGQNISIDGGLTSW